MKISYRIDDVSYYMNGDNFITLVKLFNKYNIKPLIGVIPKNEDPKLIKFGLVDFNFWDTIRQLKKCGWSVAMHGFNHVYITNKSGILKYPKKSEFSGLSIERQREKLQNGLNIMRGERLLTDIFMAPSHSFDINTIKALQYEGFNYITDGLYHTNFKLDKYKIKFIPQVSSKVIDKFLSIQTICLHPNNWSKNEFRKLEDEIIKYRDYIIDYDNIILIKEKKYNNFISLIILLLKTKGRILLKK